MKAAASKRTRLSGPYVAAKLHELDAALVRVVPRVLGRRDARAIHDLRVTIRRVRTLLKAARPIFGRFHTDAVRKAFGKVMRTTGDLRDQEALRETVEGLSRGPAFLAWRRACAVREQKSRRTVVAALKRGELEDARGLLRALLAFPIDPARDRPLAKFARRSVKAARRRIKRCHGTDLDDTSALHALRIAYKELHYTVELLLGALPQDARATLRSATRVQKRLGEIHDLDAAIQALHQARGLPLKARLELSGTLANLRAQRASRVFA